MVTTTEERLASDRILFVDDDPNNIRAQVGLLDWITNRDPDMLPTRNQWALRVLLVEETIYCASPRHSLVMALRIDVDYRV